MHKQIIINKQIIVIVASFFIGLMIYDFFYYSLKQLLTTYAHFVLKTNKQTKTIRGPQEDKILVNEELRRLVKDKILRDDVDLVLR